MIRSKEYRYLSPAYFQDKTGNLIRLDSVALVGQPNLELKAMNKALKLNSLQKQGAVRMDFLAQLATILGLAEGATEEAVISAVKALTETAAAEPAVNSTEEDGTGSAGAASADALPEAEAELLQAVETLVAVADETAGASSNKIKNAAEKAKKYLVRTSSGGQMDKATANAIHELAQKVNSLQAEVDQEKALKVVNHAVSQGKVSPSLRKWAMDYATANFAGFTDYIKNAPVLVKNSQGQEFVKSSSNAMTDTEFQVCRQLGITQEQFNKSKADSPAKN
jgi:phage I-like protein